MFDFFKNLLKKKTDENFPGLIFPKQSDIDALTKFDEVVAMANPVEWKPLDVKKLPNYPIRNQAQSGSCVAFTLALICSIIYYSRTQDWVDFSARWFYFWRSNKPTPGMVGTNALEIAAKQGVLPEVLLASDGLTEEQMNAPTIREWFKLVADVFKLDTKFVLLPVGDIETAASVVQTTGKPLMVWFKFGNGEWKKVPKILSVNPPYHHSVTFISPKKKDDMTFGIYEGEKAIVVQDSWGNIADTFDGKRIIKETFFKTRNTFVGYPFRFKFDVSSNTPTYIGTIMSFQECMRSIGLFPTNVSFIEKYGPMTRKACVDFQTKYGLAVSGSIDVATTQKLKVMFP